MSKVQFSNVRIVFWAVIFLLISQPLLASQSQETLAQTDRCPSLVTQAMDATASACGTTARNQMCYGHNLLNVEPQAYARQFTFATPGDTIPVTQIRSVRGSALDIDNATWGVALMRLQANLPDSLPNQNVTFLLFGDTQLTDAAQNRVTLALTTNANANLRSGPASSYPILASVEGQTSVVATGRLADSSWFRVWLPGRDGQTGWVFAPLLDVGSSDINTLEVIDPGAGTPSLGSLSAFYLTTTENGTSCDQLPASGLLIQTPEGAGKVRLYINEVTVDVGSTVFFQAEAGGNMVISTLEGAAVVEAAGHIEVAAAGSQLSVPLSSELVPVGPPSLPQPYQQSEFQSLPTTNLERPIEVASPLTEQDIATIHDQVQSHHPVCGVGHLPICSTVIMEGVIEAIGVDTITVNGISVSLAADSPLRRMLILGMHVRIEGNLQSGSSWIIANRLIVVSSPTPAGVPSVPDNGMGEPGMGEPGMGEPGMGEPGMGEPGMGDPGMGMGDPGMGMGDDSGMGMGSG